MIEITEVNTVMMMNYFAQREKNKTKPTNARSASLKTQETV